MMTDNTSRGGELLPCPFCGSDGEEVSVCGHLRASGHNDGWNVRCYVCHVETAYEETKAEALAAWNRRSPPHPRREVG
jgi:Lar family restriction alleviation protein